MRDITLVILNSLRIKCHIRRPLTSLLVLHAFDPMMPDKSAMTITPGIDGEDQISRNRFYPAVLLLKSGKSESGKSQELLLRAASGHPQNAFTT